AVAVLHVVAQGGVARSVVHVASVVRAQLAVQGIAVGVLQGDQGEVRAGLLLQRLRGAQRADDARGFVGVLAGANENRVLAARVVLAPNRATLARGRAEAL